MVVDKQRKDMDMEINKAKLERVVKTAKAKAAGNTRWLNAIDKAVDGLTGDAWIVTELVEGLLITTESGETYHANGACQCKAYQVGQACKHRAAARLVQMMNEEAAGAASLPGEEITRQEMQKMATDEQRRRIETITTAIRCGGDNYTLRADGKDILV